MLYIGADHRGYKLKEDLRAFLKESGYDFADLGNNIFDPNDDYTDFAKAVAEKVSQNPQNNKGILICGSGVGVDITANKFRGIRSALADDIETARQSREHDDTNVLSLPADEVDFELAKKIISAWLQTPFSNGEKYKRRIDKIE
ncbi:TPA: ribose-5-phosphate isomerase [Patescibacteria group bacterium]|nr:MAG: Ribose-5-phosphate isomerase-like protein [Parcubacteria group bacterium GW2011_GWF2_40_10]KKR47936.1 MAG: Ribose-5-phosphate isomerase-like protein [Parcubacteria group bacterium GW2011_GWA2_40_143]KKR60384.1 MAG: Ribose-5-phosphate isomerase-like protein [Parcubacteria group bacterium GW2011_GWC2_40_31]KKR75272.1 MAG: Ribose-5-phosphate isomerase-like protein [Parcubacteria group bacterium GW2011_GWB2_40_8]KKR80307.1 MAG: Ribose-5-phosphate isomerase-like protein [Parcubacteria group 